MMCNLSALVTAACLYVLILFPVRIHPLPGYILPVRVKTPIAMYCMGFPFVFSAVISSLQVILCIMISGSAILYGSLLHFNTAISAFIGKFEAFTDLVFFTRVVGINFVSL